MLSHALRTSILYIALFHRKIGGAYSAVLRAYANFNPGLFPRRLGLSAASPYILSTFQGLSYMSDDVLS